MESRIEEINNRYSALRNFSPRKEIKDIYYLLSELERKDKAFKEIAEKSGNHRECPVDFCVERVAKEALGEAKPG